MNSNQISTFREIYYYSLYFYLLRCFISHKFWKKEVKKRLIKNLKIIITNVIVWESAFLR